VSEHRRISGRYRLLEAIGEGGMGVVWRAHDELLDRTVAVKEVRYSAVSEKQRVALNLRTMREARAAGRLDHPSVVVVHDVIEEDGRPWIVMQLVRSRSLGEVVRAYGPLAPERVADIGARVLDALRTAHAAGVLHRDVKPENVLLADDGRVVLTDFGIASMAEDPALTGTGAMVGTPAFMPPERLNGLPATAESDLWSLGATLYAAVEGRPPFDRGAPAPTMAAVLYDDPAPMTRAGPLAPVIAGLLDKNPATRLHGGEAADLLGRITAGTDGLGVSAGGPHDTARRSTAPHPPGHHQGPPLGLATHPELPTSRPRALRTGLAVGVPLAVVAAGVTGFLLVNGSLIGAGGRSGPSVVTQGAGQTSDAATPPTSPSTGPISQSGTTTPVPNSSPAPTADTPAVPAGWERFRHKSGFSVAIPKGWVGRDNPTRNRVEFSGPGTPGFLWIESTEAEEKVTDPVKAWEALEAEILAKNGLRDYRRIGIRPLRYLGRPAADWEFTFQHDQDGLVRVLDRGFRMADGKPYALYWRVPADRWEQDLTYFRTFARTFRP
jgi:serine/threonine protein kinase